MPVRKVKGGWQVENTKAVHPTKKDAEKQLKAIKISQAKKGKK